MYICFTTKNPLFKEMSLCFKSGETIKVSKGPKGGYISPSTESGISHYKVYGMDIQNNGDTTEVNLEMMTIPCDLNATRFGITKGGPIESLTIH